MNDLWMRIRVISETVEKKGDRLCFYNELCEALADGLKAKVLLYSLKGKELGRGNTEDGDREAEALEEGRRTLPSSVYRRFEEIEETKVNVQKKEERLLLESCFPKASLRQFFMVVPVSVWEKHLGTLLLARTDEKFVPEDVLAAEYASMVAGMELNRRSQWSGEEKRRVNDSVDSVLSALSGSEKIALQYIFQELMGTGNDRVISRNVAKELGMAKATVGNALRKAETAGIIKIQSFGTKGTGIRVVNWEFVQKLSKEQW